MLNGAVEFSRRLQRAVAARDPSAPAGGRVVQIQDSLVYSEAINLPDSFVNLAIQAATGQRPVIALSSTSQSFGGSPAGQQLILSGLVFTGGGQNLTLPGSIDTIQFTDCAIDPGGGLSSGGATARPAGIAIVAARPATGGTLSFTRCITGPLNANGKLDCITLTDSIADAQAFGPNSAVIAGAARLLVERATLNGGVTCDVLEASLGIFDGVVKATFRQQGCVRFCYFGPTSATPRRYECAVSLPRGGYRSGDAAKYIAEQNINQDEDFKVVPVMILRLTMEDKNAPGAALQNQRVLGIYGGDFKVDG